MKPFNLAEGKIAERTYCKEQVSRRFRIVALLAVLTLGAVAVSHGCKTTTRGKASRLKSELASVQGRCLAIKNEITAMKATSSRRKWQGQLADGSKRWLGIMNAVLDSVPGDLWLNRLESSEANSNVSIEGQAASFASLSNFIGELRSRPVFSEVRINGTRVSTPPSPPPDRGEAGGPSSPPDRGGLRGGGETAVSFALQVKLKGAENSTTAQPAEQPQSVPEVGESP